MKTELQQLLLKIGGTLAVLGGATLCFFGWWFFAGIILVAGGIYLLNLSGKNLKVLKTEKQNLKEFKNFANSAQAQKIVKIVNLKEKGLITDQEYQTLKDEIIKTDNQNVNAN